MPDVNEAVERLRVRASCEHRPFDAIYAGANADLDTVLDALAEAQKARDGFEGLWIGAGEVIDRHRARADAAESERNDAIRARVASFTRAEDAEAHLAEANTKLARVERFIDQAGLTSIYGRLDLAEVRELLAIMNDEGTDNA